MSAIRAATLSDRKEVLVGTVKAAIGDVSKTFLDHRQPSDPFHDPITKHYYPDVRDQLKDYKRHDPPTKRQEALPPIVFRRIHSSAASGSSHDLAVAFLLIGAVFFALRSCEYSKTPSSETQRTQTIQVGSVRFRRQRRLLQHNDPLLHLADTVTIDFVDQKNGRRYNRVTQHRTTDPLICPVKAWAWTIRRLRSYPTTTDTTTVDSISDSRGGIHRITHNHLTTHIKSAVDQLTPAFLGFTSTQCGTHSVRSSDAMWMHLAGIPLYTIMLIGRWSSDTFLLYIRRAVQEFFGGIAQKMLHKDTFFSLATFPEPQNNTPAYTSNAGGLATARGRASTARIAFPLPYVAACA